MPVKKSTGTLLFPTRILGGVWALYILVAGVSCSGGGGTTGSGGVAGSGGAMGSGGILSSGASGGIGGWLGGAGAGGAAGADVAGLGEAGVSAGGTTVAEWTRTVVPPGIGSELESLAIDRTGNIYVSGNLWGPGTVDFGNGVTATASYDGYNGLLVKYDAAGTPQWARSGILGDIGPLAIDPAGNVWALVSLPDVASGAIDFGNGVTVTKSDALFDTVLVKYDSTGNTQWAQTVTDDSGNSGSNGGRSSLTLDGSGNIYVAGALAGSGGYDAGTDVTLAGKGAKILSPISGPVSPAYALIVKYDSSGAAQWKRTVTAITVTGDAPNSGFGAIAVDSDGSLYVSGGIGSALGSGAYDFGNGVSATAPNSVLVKYSASGIAQWIRTGASGSLALDSTGSIYVGGNMGSGVIDLGNGISAQGTLNKDAFLGTAGPTFPLLVKYDGSSGTAQWARTVATGGASSYFSSLAVDSAGNVYAAGTANGPGPYDFGNGATVAADTQENFSLLVKYSPSGVAEWARSSKHGGSAGSDDEFNAVAIDSTDSLYVAGLVGGHGDLDYGDNVTVTGLPVIPLTAGPGWNALLVKYR